MNTLENQVKEFNQNLSVFLTISLKNLIGADNPQIAEITLFLTSKIKEQVKEQEHTSLTDVMTDILEGFTEMTENLNLDARTGLCLRLLIPAYISGYMDGNSVNPSQF